MNSEEAKDQLNLININDIKINISRNKSERIKDYILQTNNPYKHECCGYTVNLKFITDEKLQEKITKYFIKKVVE